ncbi:MAG: site-2 protease family protein [Phycisphaerae bacterium]|jgi:Zn-dependent protease|nr:MAG: site-2 protease family protein [Phycisphaerae bacterium]
MMISLLANDPRQYFAILIVVIISIILHELAHGWVAVKLGDPTPIESGHLNTLNPLVHMGVFSLILLAVVGIAFGAMPINPSRLRGRYAESLVAVAGPAMNLLLAIVGTVGLGLWIRMGGVDPQSPVQDNARLLLQTFGIFNFALMLFNLLPVPPLDGSRILANLFPAYRNLLNSQMAQGFMIAIFFALFLGGAQFIFSASYAMWSGMIGWVADIGH